MRNRLLFTLALFLFFISSSTAQLIGTNTYLQGKYLEIGVCTNGSFGAPTPPAGYHAFCSCWPYSGVSALGEVYDYGHDGWAVGTPGSMGDYTLPGSPFEGWEVQMNGVRSQQYQTPGYSFAPYNYSGAATMTAAGPTSYTNTGGSARGYWNGNFNGGGATLSISQETRVDTLASAVVVTTIFRNTSGVNASNVYYWRSADPDNDEQYAGSMPGAGFTTDNMVNFQNTTIPNPTHKVEVTGTGRGTTHSPLTLCTKDCRAVALIYNSWGLSVSEDLATLWDMTYTGTAYYNVGVNHTGDIAIGLVWKLGTIVPGDSAAISYSYVFDGPTGIDSAGALPDPRLVINGIPVLSFPDTLNGCSFPGIDSVPIDIQYGDEFDWTWGKWTWTPSTGLSSTTGVHNFVHLDRIPGDITYTVTGTDSGVYMNSCLNAQFVFTVHSCHQAYGNDPCVGGAIHLGMLGDSIGASYFWYGPAGFTSFVHNPIIFPAVMADSGTYHVVRTIAGVHDTDFIHVMVHPLPVVSPASNIALCAPMADSLMLSVNLDSTFETFTWAGPFGFTSTMQSPVINPFDSSLAGTYVVTGTTRWGCQSTSSIDIYPGPEPHFTYDIHRGCFFDTVFFNNTTYNADTYSWHFGDGDSALTRHATHLYTAPATFVNTVTLTTSNAHCTAIWDTLVDRRHSVTSLFLPSPDTFCTSTPMTFINMSTTSVGSPSSPGAFNNTNGFMWDYGNGVTDTVRNPATSAYYTACGHFVATLTVTDSIGCISTSAKDVYVVELAVSSFKDTTLCISMPLPMANVVTVCPTGFSVIPQYTWTQNIPNLNDTSLQNPTLSGLGVFVDTLTISYPLIPGPGGTFGCAIRDTVTVHAVLGAIVTGITATSTIMYGTSIQLNSYNQVLYRWTPVDGSLDNPNINNPIATPSVTTTYTVYGLDVNGCLDSANVTIIVDTTSPGDMPSGFSPNNDGLNDFFRPIGSRYAKMVEFRVYNRWGEEVFYSDKKDKGWDGTFHGIPQDIGTYFYQVIVATPGGENATYKGTVTLIR